MLCICCLPHADMFLAFQFQVLLSHPTSKEKQQKHFLFVMFPLLRIILKQLGKRDLTDWLREASPKLKYLNVEYLV